MSESSDTPLLPSQIVAERTHLTIPSLPNWIEPTVEFLRTKAVMSGACHQKRSGKLLVALHEAISNALLHGNLELNSDLKRQEPDAFAAALAQRAADPNLASRTVDIVVDYDGETCHWIITDQGNGFDVDHVLARCLSDDPDLQMTSGRGILMMKSLLDDVRFTQGGRRVIMRLDRNSGTERRKDARVPIVAPFQVTPIGADGAPAWGESYEAVSRDLSEHGIALLQRQLATSAKLLIGVPTDRGVVHIPAEVKHSRPLGANGMELGCQFVEPLAPADPSSVPPPSGSPQMEAVHQAVAGILDAYHAKTVPSHDKRVHPRVVFTERVAIQIDGRPELIVAYARDLSKGGLALIAQEPLPGEVTIIFPSPTNREAFRVRSRVVRCSLIQEGFYDVGATFLRLDAR